MYTVISTHLRKQVNGHYENINLMNMTLNEIRTQFIDGYIELSNSLLDDNVYLTLDALRQSQLPMRLDMTFEYW